MMELARSNVSPRWCGVPARSGCVSCMSPANPGASWCGRRMGGWRSGWGDRLGAIDIDHGMRRRCRSRGTRRRGATGMRRRCRPRGTRRRGVTRLMDPGLLAFLATAALACAVVDLAGGLAPHPAVGGRSVRAAADVFARAGREGRDPEAAERRRLLAGGSMVALGIGWFFFGLPGGLIAMAIAPAAASRALRA